MEGTNENMISKNTRRRVLALLLVLCTAVSACVMFTGCGKKDAVLTLEGKSIQEDVYRYWLSKYKNYYITQISEIGDDEESFQKMSEDGVTVGQAIEDEALQYAKAMLCSLVLFDKYKLKLNATETEMVKAMIEDNVLYLCGGDRSKFNKLLLDTYGFSIDRLEEILLLEQKVQKVTDYLIEDGAIGYTAAELDKFYKENYYRVKIVFVNTVAKPKVDAEGKVETDILGNELTVPMTEEEKNAKIAIAEGIFAKAKDGEDFDKLVKEHSEFTNKDVYVNGYYVSNYEFANLIEAGMPKQLLLDANTAKVGDVFMVNDAASGCYIVRKEAPIDGAYQKDSADAGQLAGLVGKLLQTKYDAMVDGYWDKIKVNEDILGGISILEVKRGLNIGKIS